MLNESLHQAVQLVRTAAQMGKVNTTTMLMAIGVAHLVDQLDRGAARDALVRYNQEDLMTTIKHIKTVVGHANMKREKFRMGETHEGLIHYMDFVEKKLNALYKEFEVVAHP